LPTAQAAPAPTAQQSALADEGVPIVFKDGSTRYFPRNQVLQIVSSGDGEVGHDVSFPDGSRHIIPHENLAGALKDGGKIMDPSFVRQQAEAAPHEPTLGDYGEIGLTTALMSLGAGPEGQTAKAAIPVAERLTEETAAKLPSGIRQLWNIAKETEASSEVAASKISSQGWRQFADLAYEKASEAIESGNAIKAKAYQTAAMASKAYSKYENAWAWVGNNFKGVPLGIKIALTGQLIKEGYDFVTGSSGDDKDAARNTLFSK
jgi:hypothetical protein